MSKHSTRSWPALVRWAATALAALAAASCSLLLASAPASATEPFCVYPTNYYPGLCHGKQAATDSCARLVAENNGDGEHPPSGRYVSSSAYRITVFEQTDGGCHYVGHRLVYVFQERRDGTAGTFAPSSPVVTLPGDQVLHYARVLNVPQDCSVTPPGSAVRLAVKVKWVPDQGWGKVPTTDFDGPGAPPLKWVTYSSAESVC